MDINKVTYRYSEWVVRHRVAIVVLTLLAVACFAAGGRNLSFVNDSRIFFSKENPQLKALDALENTYSREDNVFFALAPNGGNVFTPEVLAAVAELTEACWQMPHSSRVDSLTNFQHTRAEGDDLIVEDLVGDPSTLSPEDLQRIRRIAVSEPMLVDRLISPDGRVTGINVDIVKSGKGNEIPEIMAFTRKLAREFRQKHPDIAVYITGGVPFDNAFAEAAVKDLQTLVPIMFAVLLVIMVLALKSIYGTLSTFLVIAFSMITGIGAASWLGLSMNPVSANAPTIILTLAVADSIHLLSTMFHQMREGRSRHAAVVESLRINMQPVFLTSLTTAVGFLTMNFSDVPPFRDLGNIVAIGVTAAWVYSVLFLPAFMAMLPVRVRAPAEGGQYRNCDRLANFVICRRRGLFRGMLAAVILLSLGTLRIQLNDNFIEYFDHRYEIRRDTDFIQKNLTGLDIIEYSLDSGESGGINAPRFLHTVDAFAQWYRKQPHVVHVSTMTDVFKRLNKSMHGDDPAFYRIPEKRDLAAQYLLLYEMSLPFGLDLNNQINVQKSSLRFTVYLVDVTARDLRETDARARAWREANAPPQMYTYGTGLSIMFAHISQRNIHSMLGASFGALVIISAILIIALKSFKLGVISLIPNLAPAAMAFGLWGFTMRQVGLAISVMAALTLGIVVDDTVHFMSKYLLARREHRMAPAEAVRYAFNTVGAAIAISTATLVAGFLVLAFSGFKTNANMGLMTAITIVLALVLDFFFLPVLLMKAENKSDEITDDQTATACLAVSADGGRGDR